MEKKITAVTLRATDLRESDRSVCLFSPEEGLITATMRGVRKQGAKLKFASQPLAVSRFELTEKGGRYTVTGAESLMDAYSLAADPEAYAAACLVAECTELAALSVEPDKLFVVILKALRVLVVGSVDPALVAVKFVQKTLSMSGFVAVPHRRGEEATTPSALLGAVAALTLEELEGATYPRELVSRALRLVIGRFEDVYERKVGSADVLIGLRRAQSSAK